MTCVEGGRGKGEAVLRSLHTAAKAGRCQAEDGDPSAIVPKSHAAGVAAAGRLGETNPLAVRVPDHRFQVIGRVVSTYCKRRARKIGPPLRWREVTG